MEMKLTPYSKIFYNEYKLNPKRTDYNIVVDSTIYGKFDFPKFKKSMFRLVNTNFVFRANVTEENGIPYWKLRDISEEEVVTYFPNKLTNEEIYSIISKPFDLENDLLGRHLLIKEEEEKYRLIFIYPHLIVDGIGSDEHYSKWSAYYNEEDVSEITIADQTCKMIELSDYFNKQIDDNEEKIHNFWQKHLNNISGVDLSFLKNFNPKQENVNKYIDEYIFSFDSEVLAKVKSLKSYRITPYIFGQMIFAILLKKMTKKDAIGIPFPVALLEGKDMFYGAQVNTCIIDYRFDESTTIIALINETLAFFKEFKQSKAKYLPINQSVQYANDTKVLNIAFSQTFARDSFVRVHGLSKSETNHEFQIDLINELLIEQEEGNGILNYRIRYDKHVLDKGLLQNFIKLYNKLFLEILNDLVNGKGNGLVDSYELLDTEEYTRQIEEWNNTQAYFPEDSTIHQLIEKQVVISPDEIAVVCSDRSLTYRELNNEANNLAHFLITKYNIQPNDLIGLCFDRNSQAIITILAILKAGGAYVAIDGKLSDTRIQYIVKDSACKLVLTNELHYNRFENIIPVESIDNKDVKTELQNCLYTNPVTSVKSSDLAYIIYTSGTTGQPKGVMIEHKGVVNLIYSLEHLYKTREGENKIHKNCILYANFIFDAHVLDFYPPLTNGHTVYLPADEYRYDFKKLSEYIDTHKINHGLIPPAILDKDNLLNVDILMVGGESTSYEIMKNYSQAGITVLQMYGPTESTVANSYHYYEQGDSYKNIGRPFNNQKFYVLDPDLNIIPVGVIGELHIGGIGIARGYLNKPEITREKFIANPFQTEEEKELGINSTLYKTGDLVRYLSNGDIEYMGRNDFQVKIRGFRVELGEIESALSNYQTVKQSVVIAKEHSNGKKYLVAYYLSDKEYNEDDINTYMHRLLPDYMVPSAYVCLEEFPITINGKIDFKTLPDPKIIYVGADNEIEKKLCGIFAEVLGLEEDKISTTDDFLRLGGDSITSIQLVNKIRQKLNVNLTVQDIHNYKNVKTIATKLIEGFSNKKEILAEQGILEGNIDLLPIQEWFFDNVEKNVLPEYNHWNQAFMLSVPKLDEKLLQESIKRLVEYHDTFRILYKKEKNLIVQYYKKEVLNINYNSLDISTISETDLEAVLTGWQNNFNIYEGPIYHIGYLYNYSDDTARLHVALHHLIVDAVSWKIISSDLKTIYEYLESQSTNESIIKEIKTEQILGKKGTSYRQWTEIIKKHNTNCKKELIYWDNINEDVPAYNSFWIPQYQEQQQRVLRTIGEKYTEKIQREGINNIFHTETRDILLTTLALTLADYTNHSSHYITLEGHGREELEDNIDINNTVGWFTTLYPVKLNIAEDKKDIKKSLIQIKEKLRLIPNKGIGYGALFGYTDKELPVIAFNYLGQYESNNSATWSFVQEELGQTVSLINKDKNIISINCVIFGGELKLFITGQLPVKVLSEFAETFESKLKEIINTLEEEERTYLTLSDINYVISEEYLGQIQKEKEVENIYLANSLQQGFIYHYINQGKLDSSYRVQFLWEYTSPIYEEILKKAWDLAMKRFPVLRLSFAWKEELVQIINKEGNLKWNYYDCSKLSEAEQINFYAELSEKDKEQNYDLSEKSLFRLFLLKEKENKYNFIFNFHHAILDGWSVPVLLAYIHQTYIDLLNNKNLTEEIENTYLDTQNYIQLHTQEHIEFWKDYIATVKEKEDLISLLKPENKHVNLSTYKQIKETAEKHIIIEEKQYQQLKNICSSIGVTLNVFIQYCWHKCLSIYTNDKTTVVGMVTSGRNLPVKNIENSVGLYINTLPVIIEHKDNSLIEALKDIQEILNTLNSKTNVNLAELETGEYRLFNSLFAFENYPKPKQAVEEELSFNFLSANDKQDYPIVIAAYDEDEKIIVKLNYANELFAEEQIERVLSIFTLIAEQFISNQLIRTKEIEYLAAEDKNLLLKWNETYNKNINVETTIQAVFEEKVKVNPERIAVVYEDAQLTYAQLNQKANQLAHYLQTVHKIQPDDLVVICQERTENVLISILAVLKSGGAYIPIDPSIPQSRLEFILKDSESKLALTNTSLENKFDVFNTHVIAVDSKKIIKEVEEYSTENLPPTSTNNNLCYVIYTSGTTGQPKGVMIEHKGVCNLAYTLNETYNVDNTREYKKCLGFSNLSFDAHVLDFYPTLLYGHTLYLIGDTVRLNTKKLSSYIEDNEVELALIPPVLLDSINILGLKSLAVGGESTNLNIFENYTRQGIKVYNSYGPTEITVCSSSNLFTEGDSNTNIGRVMDNVTYYILDENNQLLPIGAVGELHIGGIGVARGYLNKPDLTAEKFISNPYQTEQEKVLGINGRLYKTGDLARYLSNGEVEYMGRNDFQVKIRGFRIELGEIENSLSKYKNINRVVAQAKELSPGVKYLVAYYLSDETYTNKEMVEYLSQTLPDYMVPTVFVRMDKFPVTVNGKIDLRGLPEPDLQDSMSYTAPENETEEKLCKIYADILNLNSEKISVEEDFFALGGSSILAIRLMSKINKEFNKEIKFNSILQYRNVRSLAQNLMQQNSLERNRIQQVDLKELKNQPLLSFSQERMWFLETFEGGSNVYNIPMIFELNENTSESALLSAINKIIDRHQVLRSKIKTTKEGVGYQEVYSEPLKVECLKVDSEEILSRAITDTINRVFSIWEEYPIHVQLYELGQKRYITITIHHIAFDGWSSDIFLNELLNYYHYYSKKQVGDETYKSFELPEIKNQYNDYAIWFRKYLSETVINKQIDYWKDHLADYRNLNLQTDKKRPVFFDYKGDNKFFELPTDLSLELRVVSKDLNVSLYTVLLSGYYLLLSSYCSQKDIIVGTPVAGRHYEGVDDIIGCFVNTLVLRHQIENNQTITDYIKQIADEVTQALINQDLPFERLVKELKVDKDTSRNPVFQVMFGVQAFGKKDLPELKKILKFYDVEKNVTRSSSQFDFTLMLDDSEDQIKGLMNYATSLFESNTIDNYIATYINILKQLVSLYKDKKQTHTIVEINPIKELEQEKILMSWNETYNKNINVQNTIQAIFEAQAKKTPNKIAIVHKGEQLTYAQLNQKANQLAHYLQTVHKIQPDDLISICQERSEKVLISILAVLKSGAAYVPIDPGTPESRLEFILQDTKSKTVLTNSSLKRKFETLNTHCTVIDSKKIIKEVEEYSTENLPPTSTNNNLCYVIYTSGTTGQPKGVMIEHKGVANLSENIFKLHAPNILDNNLCYYHFNFDAHAYEVYPVVLNGGTLFMVEEDMRLDIKGLDNYMQDNNIRRAIIPQVLLDDKQIFDLDMLVVGGETPDWEILKGYTRQGIKVYNSYGPTEITVCSSNHLFTEGDNNTNIGRVMDNVTYYILDENNQLLPIGAVGELHIGGIGVARGYLNKPDLTAEKFISNPYQTEQEKALGINGRLYKTGDLARYLSNGEAEYMGRNDFQVKIRGFRIELGEIENSLSKYKNINRVVAQAKELSPGVKYLVAYYLSDETYTNKEMVEYLSQTLPDYMVPTAFVRMDKFPVTVNGKIDLRGLPEPDLQDSMSYTAPENETEEKLCKIYADILNLNSEKISVEEDFFALGGSSILAIRLMSKINLSMGTNINLTEILSNNTIRSLSHKIANQKYFTPVTQFNKSEKPPVFMIHPSMGDSDVYLQLADRLKSIFSCYGINSYNRHHNLKIDNLSILANKYLSEIDKIQQDNITYNLMGWSLGGQFALEIAAQLEAKGVENITVFLFDTWLLYEGLGTTEEEKRGKMELLMNTFNIPDSERVEIRKVLVYDELLAMQSISRKLKHTKIILFRAVEDKNTEEYRKKYPINNIDSCIDINAEVQVIDIDAEHNSILKHEEFIFDNIESIVETIIPN